MQLLYLMDRPELVRVLARLHYEEWSYLRPGESREERTSRLRGCMGHREIPTVVVALDNEVLLGSAMLVLKDLDTHRQLSPWLAAVYVIREFRGQGVATSLVRRIIDEAEALGIRKLYLYTPSAERFFSRQGWSVMEHALFHDTTVAVMCYEICGLTLAENTNLQSGDGTCEPVRLVG